MDGYLHFRTIKTARELTLTWAVIDEAIDGEALVALQHPDLKDVGITSVGHRLTILKAIYEVKIKQNVTVDADHYVPPCT